jgi:hypothetical protein
VPTAPKIDTCFVISPFGDPFDTYFAQVVKPAIEDCALYAIRGDSLYRPTTIVDDIWQGIQTSKLLIAELTDRNPNVFYELGLAHALSKPVILISHAIEDIPFDLRAIRVLLYDKDHPDWGTRLRESLTQAIREVLVNPLTAIPTTFKKPIRIETPEESETLLRLEAMEAAIIRLSESISTPSDNADNLITKKDRELAQSGTRRTLQLKPGDAVHHKKFGRGKVITLEGDGLDLRAQINFDRSGVKWLLLAYAELRLLIE